MITPADSSAELLTLHAIRLKGMADDAEVAARFRLDLALARELLLDFQAFGWITRAEFRRDRWLDLDRIRTFGK